MWLDHGNSVVCSNCPSKAAFDRRHNFFRREVPNSKNEASNPLVPLYWCGQTRNQSHINFFTSIKIIVRIGRYASECQVQSGEKLAHMWCSTNLSITTTPYPGITPSVLTKELQVRLRVPGVRGVDAGTTKNGSVVCLLTLLLLKTATR